MFENTETPLSRRDAALLVKKLNEGPYEGNPTHKALLQMVGTLQAYSEKEDFSEIELSEEEVDQILADIETTSVE